MSLKTTLDINQLLVEFKGLYEERLRCLDLDTTVIPELILQRKVDFLWSYVNDLEDQNQVLVQTIDELQREAENQVSSSGVKLHTSDWIVNVPGDLSILLQDVGPTASIPHQSRSLVQVTSESEDVRVHFQPKDTVASDAKRELRGNALQKKETVLEGSEKLVRLQREISCLQQIQKDNVKEIAEKDICITKLQTNVLLLQQEGVDTHAQLSESNARVSELQEEVKRKEEEWMRREDEQRLKHEQELKKAQEGRRQEQRKREEEWVERAEEEEKRRDEEWMRKASEEKKAGSQAIKKWAEKAVILNSELEVSRKQTERQSVELSECHQREESLLSKIKEREAHVRHLDEDFVGLRATQDTLKRTLAMKEKHTQQLVQDNTRLKDSMAALQSKFQTSESMVSDVSTSLDQAKASLNVERQRREQIQEQFYHASEEAERLQQELTRVRCTAEKKLLSREKALEKLQEERDDLRAKMEDRSKECIHLSQTKEGLEADLALSREKLHTSHLEVRSRDQLILQLRAEMKTAEQTHRGTQKQVVKREEVVRQLKQEVKVHQDKAHRLSEKVQDIERLKDQKKREQQQLYHQLEASEGKLKEQQVEMELLHKQLREAEEDRKQARLQEQEQKETVAIFKQKYTAAIEKVHKVQRQVEHLEEELRYSQQQLSESRLATDSVKEELTELKQRYREKVSQWESSQEVLEQLTDGLQAGQNLLRESQQNVEHFRSLTCTLQEQGETVQQQKLMIEHDLRLYQESHSHSDEEYLRLLRHRRQLQTRCSKQVERLSECEKIILQMKSELERQNQEKASLKESIVASHRGHLSKQTQLEQEVTHLKKEITRLEFDVTDTQKVGATLLRQSEEELKEAKQEAASRSRELDVEREEVCRLHEELDKEKEKMMSVLRDNQSLSSHVKTLSLEVKELRSKHQLTVEELAAREEEVKRMAGCLDEGKLAHEKIRSVAVKREMEVMELRKNLHQAEREKQEVQVQVETLQCKLERMRSDNANLRHESQLAIANVKRWITEQKASNKSLATQMKAQNKVLLVVTEEKEHLQEANDTLKAEVKSLKEVADEKETETGCFKARIQDQFAQHDERSVEERGCVALSLSKIQDMEKRLQSNLEAIRMLNQQLNALSSENKRLRRQLEEERSRRRQVERQLPHPPTSQHSSSVHIPFSLGTHPPLISTSSLRLPHPLSLDQVTKPKSSREELG